MKFLVIIDMQNDFIDGSLKNANAQRIVKPIAEYASNFDGIILATRDTHFKNYLETYEGRHLPVVHCVMNTAGWNIHKDIKFNHSINKVTFNGALELYNVIQDICDNNRTYPEQIEFVGTVTEICVISNVLGLKPYFPETEFIVHANMCAGLSDEGHKAALTVMKACQVNVIE